MAVAHPEGMARRLEKKVALVTGGARGIGAATVAKFADEGCRVVVADVLEEEGRALVELLKVKDVRAAFVKLDVTSAEQWAQAVALAEKTFGALHVLVNNAGISRLEDVAIETVEGWNQVISVNQTGVWLGMRAAIPALLRGRNASIVNVSSIFGAVGGNGTGFAYHASKGAIRTMTKSAAVRYAPVGLRVNSVHPGFIDTAMLEPILEGKDPASRQLQDYMIKGTPMQRLGQPYEVAAAIAFLASDEAAYVTGAELYVDGGWTAV